MFRVLTVAREFGSGGSTISRMVAERLGWRLFDREIVDEVVRMAGVDLTRLSGVTSAWILCFTGC